MIFLLEKKKNRGGDPRQGVDYRVLRLPRPSLPLSCQRSSSFFFSSSRQVRRGVCLVAALSTTVAKATPLPRWAFRARFHPFVARIPLVHTRHVAVCVCARACISVGTTHEGENAERILERRSSSRIDDFFILALILEVFSRGIICSTKWIFWKIILILLIGKFYAFVWKLVRGFLSSFCWFWFFIVRNWEIVVRHVLRNFFFGSWFIF